MAILTPYQSNAGISVGNAGSAGPQVTASAFMTPGQAALPDGLNKLAQGMDKLGGALFDVANRKRQEQMELALIEDMQGFQSRSQAFGDNYQQRKRGRDAANAEDDAKTFYQTEMDALRERWKGNDTAQLYIQQHGGSLASSGVNAMRDYGNKQQEAWKDSVFARERAMFTNIVSDWSRSPEEKRAAHARFSNRNVACLMSRGVDQTRARIETRDICRDIISACIEQQFLDRLNNRDLAGAEAALAVMGGDASSSAHLQNSQPTEDLNNWLQGTGLSSGPLMPPDKIRQYQNMLEHEQQKSLYLTMGSFKDAVAYGQESGDFSRADDLLSGLASLGTGTDKEFAKAAATLPLYKESYGFLRNAREYPIAGQAAEATEYFSKMIRENPAHAADIATVRDHTLANMNHLQQAFHNDPAAYVATQQKEEFPSAQARIEDSLRRQEYMARGLGGFVPKVLPEELAKDMNARFGQELDTWKQAQMLAEWGNTYGEYASRAFAQAKLPDAAIAVAQVGKDMPPATLAKFVSSALVPEKDLPKLTDEAKAQLQSSKMVPALQGVKDAMYASSEMRDYVSGVSNAMEKFVRGGGKPSEIENNFLIINDGNMKIVAPASMRVDMPDRFLCRDKGIEDALRIKTDQLFNNAWGEKYPLPPEAEQRLSDLEKIRLNREYQFTLRSMIENGTWVFDGTDGFVLVNAASGGIAHGTDGKVIRVTKAEIPDLARQPYREAKEY